jgi:hypothetical protein
MPRRTLTVAALAALLLPFWLRADDAPAEPLLERVRTEFADILKAGTFEVSGPLPAESNDVQLADLARLRFRFDRHSMGRLRMLIDLINREG